MAAALDGVYGAWINIDGFTVGEQREIYAGLRIFELAKQTKSLRHYIWSSLDYNLPGLQFEGEFWPPLSYFTPEY